MTSSAAARTDVVLTFDDASADQYAIKGMLTSHSAHATFFVNSGKVGSTDYYMTWPQISALAADGNEIGGHTRTHADLTTLTPEQQRDEVCGDRQELIARGFDVTSFAYPHGNSNAAIKALLADCGYSAARRIGGIASAGWCPDCMGPYAEPQPPADPLALRTPQSVGAEITLDDLQSHVTKAEQSRGGLVVLVFHRICSSICADSWVSPATLAAFLDWMTPRAASGTLIGSLREALSRPPPEVALPGARAAPVVTAFIAVPPEFRVARRPSAISPAARLGTRFRFRVSQTGTIKIRIERRVNGTRLGSRCVAPVRQRPGSACTRWASRGVLTSNVRRGGINRVPFGGWLHGRPLPVGRYRAVISATDVAGNHSTPRRTNFTITDGAMPRIR